MIVRLAASASFGCFSWWRHHVVFAKLFIRDNFKAKRKTTRQKKSNVAEEAKEKENDFMFMFSDRRVSISNCRLSDRLTDFECVATQIFR